MMRNCLCMDGGWFMVPWLTDKYYRLKFEIASFNDEFIGFIIKEIQFGFGLSWKPNKIINNNNYINGQENAETVKN